MDHLRPEKRIEIARVGSDLIFDRLWRAESTHRIESPRDIVWFILDLTKEGPHCDELFFFGIGRKRKATFLFHPASISRCTKISRFHLSHSSNIFSSKPGGPQLRSRDLWVPIGQPATSPKE